MITVTGIIISVLLLLFLVYASADIRSGVYVKAVSRLPTNEKILALTFDDGPHPDTTPLILDLLKKYNIQAAFFCIGKNIEKNKSLANRIINEGHWIGNHTNQHGYAFPFYSNKRMKMEIEACRDQMVSVGSSDSPRLFRPPFGVTNPSLRKALKNSGYTVIGWNIRSLDTIIGNPEVVIRRVTKKIKPGSILLFHDSQAHTPEIVERIINFALNKGYNFVRVDKYI